MPEVQYFYTASAFALGLVVGWYLSVLYWEKKVKNAEAWHETAVQRCNELEIENEQVKQLKKESDWMYAVHCSSHKCIEKSPIGDETPIYAGDEVEV